MMSAWHNSVASELALPKLYDLDEVVEAFEVPASRYPSPGSACGSFPSRHDEADTSIARAWWTGSTTTSGTRSCFGSRFRLGDDVLRNACRVPEVLLHGAPTDLAGAFDLVRQRRNRGSEVRGVLHRWAFLPTPTMARGRGRH